MNQAHIRAILEGIVPEVKAAISVAQKPLLDRIDDLEKRAPEKGQDGKSVTLDDVRPVIMEAVAALPPAEPGKSVTIDDMRPILEEMVASLPKAEDGKSVTLDDVAPRILDHFQANFSDLAKSMEEIEPRLSAPPELAEKIALGVRMLAEAPPLQIASAVSPSTISLDLKGISTKRKLVFERDANNRIIAAHEEAQA